MDDVGRGQVHKKEEEAIRQDRDGERKRNNLPPV